MKKVVDSFYPKMFLKNKKTAWSTGWIPNFVVLKQIKKIDPDLIHLHWFNEGFLVIKNIKEILELGKPVVWTLHDSWPFTGGCHLPGSCENYFEQCGYCPYLKTKRDKDLSRRLFLKKKKVFSMSDFILITPSPWLKGCATNSGLFKHKKIIHIPNAIDFNDFKFVGKAFARKALSLKSDKKYLLFGATGATEDNNKGFDLLLKSLENFKREDVEVLVFGNSTLNSMSLDIKARFFGVVKDRNLLRNLFSASDVTLVPSRSESFSLVTLESLASGTPVVAFDIGGIPELIEHKKDGYLAKPFDTKDFLIGIEYFLAVKRKRLEIRKKAKRKFSRDLQVKRHIEVYNSLIEKY